MSSTLAIVRKGRSRRHKERKRLKGSFYVSMVQTDTQKVAALEVVQAFQPLLFNGLGTRFAGSGQHLGVRESKALEAKRGGAASAEARRKSKGIEV